MKENTTQQKRIFFSVYNIAYRIKWIISLSPRRDLHLRRFQMFLCVKLCTYCRFLNQNLPTVFLIKMATPPTTCTEWGILCNAYSFFPSFSNCFARSRSVSSWRVTLFWYCFSLSLCCFNCWGKQTQSQVHL